MNVSEPTGVTVPERYRNLVKAGAQSGGVRQVKAIPSETPAHGRGHNRRRSSLPGNINSTAFHSAALASADAPPALPPRPPPRPNKPRVGALATGASASRGVSNTNAGDDGPPPPLPSRPGQNRAPHATPATTPVTAVKPAPPPRPVASKLAGNPFMQGAVSNSTATSTPGSSAAKPAPKPRPASLPVVNANAGSSGAGLTVTAIHDFVPQASGDLALTAGDVITLTDYSGTNWWSGKLSDGSEGQFPVTYISEKEGAGVRAFRDATSAKKAGPASSTGGAVALGKNQVVAAYDYSSTEAGDLSFKKGDVITMTDTSGQNWWKGTCQGKTGAFPVSYLEEAAVSRLKKSDKPGDSAPKSTPAAAAKPAGPQLHPALLEPKLTKEEQKAAKEKEKAEKKAKKEEEKARAKREKEEAKAKKQAEAQAEATPAEFDPSTARPRTGKEVLALFDQPGSTPEDLVFRAGDILTVVAVDGKNWWSGSLNGNAGKFPLNYCDPGDVARVQEIDAASAKQEAIPPPPPPASTPMATVTPASTVANNPPPPASKPTAFGASGGSKPPPPAAKPKPGFGAQPATTSSPPPAPAPAPAPAAEPTKPKPPPPSSKPKPGFGQPGQAASDPPGSSSSSTSTGNSGGGARPGKLKLPAAFLGGAAASTSPSGPASKPAPVKTKPPVPAGKPTTGIGGGSTATESLPPPPPATEDLPPPPPPVEEAPPVQRPSPIGSVITALYDFAGLSPGDLMFKAGQEITVTGIDDDNWWVGRVASGASGKFPLNYVDMSSLGADPSIASSAVSMARTRQRGASVHAKLRRRASFSGTGDNQSDDDSDGSVDLGDNVNSSPAAPAMDKEKKREMILAEILSSEQVYIHNLSTVMKVYVEPLQYLANRNSTLILTLEQITSVFQNTSEILTVSEALCAQLAARKPEESLGQIFINACSGWSVYESYCKGFEDALHALSQAKTEQKFVCFLDESNEMPECKGRDLASFLIMPVQRVPRYELLLRDLIKSTPPGHPDLATLKEAQDRVCAASKNTNQRLAEADNMKRVVELQSRFSDKYMFEPLAIPNRRLIRRGKLTKKPVKGGGLEHRRHFFLFNDIIVYAGRNKKTDQFEYKGTIHLIAAQVKVQDNDKKECSFQVITTKGTYLITADDKTQRDVWIQDIQQAISETQLSGMGGS